MPTRKELQRLARERLRDAQILQHRGRHDAAAYMCGYVLELALKACICKTLQINDYPEKRLHGEFKTHGFDDLKLLAGFESEITAKRNPKLFANWSIVARWSPDWRYRPIGSVTESDADAILAALRKRQYGILPWLRKRW